ncbi:suppressor of fused domain protein [Streptomyces sp. TLI_146]|uniref:suppressor of fused domain protein n=1 Tax=Streptomyces sp. TLI_146 TaxID=1938858 RepID=UPI000C70B779|nr:suppressor of fused domain protein [Streptomyces sp. TLI_146]PKV87995.1 suppressor of fused protein SUFU [Streptomyces sp. TLI_146]
MAALVNHLEARLGRMVGSWSAAEQSPPGTPQVGYFTGGALEGVQSFATVGLFSTPLVSRTSGRHQHLELLGCNRPLAGDEYGPFAGVLEYVSERLVTSGDAVLRGDVISLPMPLAPGSVLSSLYASSPVYFDDDFAEVVVENGTTVSVVWLVPIGPSEAAFVKEKGWPEFEQELVRQDPDLLDLRRREITL